MIGSVVKLDSSQGLLNTIRQGIFEAIKFCGSPKLPWICNFYEIKFSWIVPHIHQVYTSILAINFVVYILTTETTKNCNPRITVDQPFLQ